MIELWQLSFHFVPLEEVIFCLLTHWWNQIKLPGYRVRFLCKHKSTYKANTAYFYSVTCREVLQLTIISIADQRDVPQYMDMPWLMTCVMALTISVTKKHTVDSLNNKLIFSASFVENVHLSLSRCVSSDSVRPLYLNKHRRGVKDSANLGRTVPGVGHKLPWLF